MTPANRPSLSSGPGNQTPANRPSFSSGPGNQTPADRAPLDPWQQEGDYAPDARI